jgi:Na+-transporting methylmalonyl-CoA/oxaloacetate decarboxylase gamma subunit
MSSGAEYENTTMERMYRPTWKNLLVGLCAIPFLGMGTIIFGAGLFMGGILIRLAGICFGAFFLFMLAYAIHYILFCIRHRLHVSETSVEHKGIHRIETIDFQDLTEARWRPYDKWGRLILQTSDAKIDIDFSDYPKEHSSELVCFFRRRLPETIQRDWDRYWKRHWSMFDKPDVSDAEAIREATRKMRLRMFYILLGGYILFALCFYFVRYYSLQNPELFPNKPPIVTLPGLIVPNVVLLILGAWLIFSLSASTGKVGKKYPVEEKGKLLIFVGFLGVFLTMPAFAFAFNGISHGIVVSSAFFAVELMFMALTFWGLLKFVNQQKKKSAEAPKTAEELFKKSIKDSKE